MPLTLSRPSWKHLAIPLFMTFGFPLLVPALMLARAWAEPGLFPSAAGLPFLSLLVAYVYFPMAMASRGIFNKSNALKSVLLGLAAYEIYRQLLVIAYKASGTSFSEVIQQHCGGDVDVLQAASACVGVVAATLFWSSLLLWLVPAALLCSISRRRVPIPLGHSEA